MASFNKITIVGYLGRDPELKYTANGEAVCKLSVATTEKRKVNGEVQESTIWFRITVWGRQAEACEQYLQKGRQVYVEGTLRQAQYTDREGNERTSLEVNAKDIQFLGGSSVSLGEGDGQQSSSPQSAAREAEGIDEDEIPF